MRVRSHRQAMIGPGIYLTDEEVKQMIDDDSRWRELVIQRLKAEVVS